MATEGKPLILRRNADGRACRSVGCGGIGFVLSAWFKTKGRLAQRPSCKGRQPRLFKQLADILNHAVLYGEGWNRQDAKSAKGRATKARNDGGELQPQINTDAHRWKSLSA